MYSMIFVIAVISAVVIAVHLYCLGVLFDCQLRHCSASYVNETNAADTAENNWDVSAKYAEGAITATVKTDESEDWAIEGTYDMGNGLTVAAGLADAGDDIYVGGTYDLGGGASLLVSYADDSDADEEGGDNDIGAPGYQVGTTVAVSFKF
jgi:outer membrane protein OmpU